MKHIEILEFSGDFAENKDVARMLRTEKIEPVLTSGEDITLDFANVSSATQSFIHALLSQTMRDFGIDVLDRIVFKNCSDNVRTIIEIVIDYVQDGIFTEEDEAQEKNNSCHQ